MGRFTTPRRMGSTGWLMHAASRSAYNNRGSNAAWAEIQRQREEECKNINFGFCLVFGTPLLLLSLLLLVAMLATGGYAGLIISALLAMGLPLWKALATN